jgi:hypothetical protein
MATSALAAPPSCRMRLRGHDEESRHRIGVSSLSDAHGLGVPDKDLVIRRMRRGQSCRMRCLQRSVGELARRSLRSTRPRG